MGIRAVRTPNQDVLSSVMRRQIIESVSPLVSLDRKSNPLSGSTDGRKLNRLLEKFGFNVRELLVGLSDGEISIRDFSARTIKILDEIHRDEDADGKFLREMGQMVSGIQIKMDAIAANVRRLMHMDDEGPRPADTKLSNGDAALLSLIEAARAQIGNIVEQNDKTPPPQPQRPIEPPAEHPKSLRIIRDSDGKPVKDHPEYGPMLTKFLESKGVTKIRCPQIVALYELLATLPLGKSMGKTEIATKIGPTEGAFNALINRLKKHNLHLNMGGFPQTTGCFIRVAGREPKKNREDPPGHYRYELVIAVEE